PAPAVAAPPTPPAQPAAATPEAKPQRSWPINPMNGEPPLTLFRHKKMVELPIGLEVDRFGDGSGNLVYAAGTPFPERSLVPSWINRPYRVYRLRRPVEALTGIAVPWFEQPGGGTAYLMPKTIEDMLADGVLVEVANQEAPTH
ncbi:TNT domain-containing protein, partial [Saccharothrix hoggarensis]